MRASRASRILSPLRDLSSRFGVSSVDRITLSHVTLGIVRCCVLTAARRQCGATYTDFALYE